jgi:hypothetical protein
MTRFLRRTRAALVVRRPPARRGIAGDVIMAASGLRHPIVVILLLIAFFATISGKPLDGLLMLLVAVGLAWDTGKRFARRASAGDVPAAVSRPSGLAQGPSPGTGDQPPAAKPGPDAGGLRRRAVLAVTWLAAGALYAAIVGSFSRYSWPATVGVVVLGAVVVLIGWQGPLRQRPDPGRLPPLGTAMWGGLLVAGGLWELAALIQQPSLTTSSSAHPTISTLTDPLLSSHGGRSAALAAWLLLGWFLAER